VFQFSLGRGDKLRIAVLTGGGDCPGLNAAIRAVAQRGWTMDDEVCGIHYGWSGLTGEGEMHTLSPIEVRDILHESGTMLGTSRTNPGRSKEDLEEVVRNLRRHAIDGLVAIGGDDTLSVAAKLHEAGVKVVGIPKTIDNDVPGTDFCIGFDTATGVIADALDRLLSTAKSHARIMVTEVMGRDTGWLAVVGGLAGGADFIAIPEVPVHIDYIIEHAAQHIATHRFSVMAIAEGTQVEGLEVPKAEVDASDQFGHVRLADRGIAQRVADEIERRTGIDTRVTVLGHLQRGGTPSVRDRYISTLMGSAAVDFLHRDILGCMTSLKGQEIVSVPLSEIAGKTWSVPPELYELGRRFFRTMAALESPQGT
jgi:6-phosphofructokinase 1